VRQHGGVKAQQLVDRARAEQVAGRPKAALGPAWDAVQAAMRAQDEGPVRDVQLLARDIAASSEGGVRADAEKLAAYCAALLEGVGGGVRMPGLLERMLLAGRSRPGDDRRPCPECAESIKREAKVCRFCGHPMDS
jgi:hypothetical protein